MSLEPQFRWCRDQADAEKLASLFVSDLPVSYISHSELQGWRAVSPDSWADNLAEIIGREFLARVNNSPVAADRGATSLLGAATVDGVDVSVFLVMFARTGRVPFCVLEDIVVMDKMRGKGIGAAIIAWLERQCAEQGISRMFLESGITNHAAHDLFKRVGFSPVSVVMMKQLA